MNNLKTTNILLLIIALPILFYVINILSFIFVPLIFSMLIALLFLPLMRWLNKKKVPKIISLILVLLIISIFFKFSFEVIKLASNEIANSNTILFDVKEKIEGLLQPLEQLIGLEKNNDEDPISHYLKDIDVKEKITSVFGFLSTLTSQVLLTLFFVILWLVESVNFQKVLNKTILKQKFSSIKVFARIEKDILTFIKVKIVISFFTGLGFTLACYLFDVSFPIFWGLLAFAINFVQMIGSIISIVLLAAFAFIEINTTGSLLFFILTITLVQAIMGGILEPIFMGKSFSINVITILIMLLFWGFIWGVSGMILAIPLTVFLKIMFEQFPKTKIISSLMSSK